MKPDKISMGFDEDGETVTGTIQAEIGEWRVYEGPGRYALGVGTHFHHFNVDEFEAFVTVLRGVIGEEA